MLKQLLGKLPRRSLSASSSSASASPSTSDDIDCNGNNTKLLLLRTSSAVFPSSVIAGIEPLLPFKDAPSEDKKMSLFISKLSLCCMVFDFNLPALNAPQKDLKRTTLVEILDFVSNAPPRFSEPAILALCKMCAVNLFRVFPPSYRPCRNNASTSSLTNNGDSSNVDDDEPCFDPAWPHLQLVYDILLKFVTSVSVEPKVAKKYINHSFILRMLDLFESQDPRERDALKAIMHRIYGKFMVHRPFIRNTISNVFYRFVFENERHNGIAELLEIFGSVITGFALPLKEEHKIFLWRALIPLHKPKSLGVYFQQLSYCITSLSKRIQS